MAKTNYPNRVFFSKGKQKEFLTNISNITGFEWNKIAKKIGVSKRTLFDWRREKYTISLSALKKLCKLAGLEIPKSVEIKDPFWYIPKASSLGGKITWEKYGQIGNSEKRKKNWRKWWEKRGKFQIPQNQSLEIYEPSKSKELAEFIGIMLGDGNMTDMQLKIYLNTIDDKSYIKFVEKLIERLFKLKPTTVDRNDCQVSYILISRKKLVDFCKELGLVIGDKIKNNAKIPNWIMENRQYKIACIRGIFDTDGCVYDECHKINNKSYSYLRAAIVNKNPCFRGQVARILKELGFSPRIRNNRSVNLELKQDVIKYFIVIGSNNPKHRNRYQKILGRVG